MIDTLYTMPFLSLLKAAMLHDLIVAVRLFPALFVFFFAVAVYAAVKARRFAQKGRSA